MTEERDLAGKRVYVSGHRGMVGAALVRRLASEQCNILTVDRAVVDLTFQTETEHWITEAKPDAVILAAAKVGGIAYNNACPVDFLFDNLAIAPMTLPSTHLPGWRYDLKLCGGRIVQLAAPDNDVIPLAERYDGCHLNGAGAEHMARLWYDILRSSPNAQY